MSRSRPWWLPHATRFSFIIFFITCFVTGCGSVQDEDVTTFKNRPPTVWLDGGPPEGGVSVYKIEFSWGGHDPDGSISHFEYCITNNDGAFDPADTTGAERWTQTTKTRDTFVFSADVPVDSVLDDQVEEFRRSHTFFVRSVDDQGAVSPESAYRSFTARTLSPEVTVLRPRGVWPNPSSVPPIATYEWHADDFISDYSTRQDPEAVSWILEPISRHNDDRFETIDWIRRLSVDAEEWGDWVPYGAPDGSGKRWTTLPTDYGIYIFAIRAMDEAGAITPVFDTARNLRFVSVRSFPNGPLLTLENSYFGRLLTSLCNTPVSIVDVPAGVRVGFVLTADARSYGGTAVAYRFGWDVANPDDPDDWWYDWTQFPPHDDHEPATVRLPPATFFSNTHTFRVEVADDYSRKSCVELRVNFLQTSMTKNLLLVDDFKEPTGSGWQDPVGMGFLPNDEEHDQFWLDALAGLEGFNPQSDVIDISERGDVWITLEELLQYKSVIWSVYGWDQPHLYDLISFRPMDKYYPPGDLWANPLALYMAAGGHVLITGEYPVNMSINVNTAPGIRYPVVFRYELDLRRHGQDVVPDPTGPTGDHAFPYRDLCLETMEFAQVTPERWRASDLTCSNTANRTLDNSLRNHTMRAAQPIDYSYAFPRLELRPETAAPGKAHAPDVSGLDAEVYNPTYFADLCPFVPHNRGCFEPIYGLECIVTDEPVYGEPVAFWTGKYADTVAEAPGAVGARSAVFGFAPVMFNPDQSIPAIEIILFDEWRLPHIP